MEKSAAFQSLPPQDVIASRKPKHYRLGLGVIGLLSALYFCFTPSSWSDTRLDVQVVSMVLGKSEFSWSKIEPSKALKYTPCFGKYQCARLDVPMDYNSTDPNGSRVAVAVIKLPASVPVTDPRYAGPILINPGGPGGSGVSLLTGESGDRIATIVNPDSSTASNIDSKFYDIMSFDPRGVNNTTPRLSCYPDGTSFDIFQYQIEADGIDGSSSQSFSNTWARAKAVAESCSSDQEISRHMTTPVVVADMVEIIERHAEWRSLEAKKWLASQEGQAATAGKANCHTSSKDAVLERTQWRQGEEKLNYWGFSYGTILGATFAAMQPHRSQRVIIDGVASTDDYYEAKWLKNLLDTDTIMEKFFDYCSTAGPEKCPLNSGNLTSSDIKSLVETLLTNLREDPIAVRGSATRGPEIITYSDVMQLIRFSVYKPLRLFLPMATLLDDLISGNGSAFADHKDKAHEPSCPLQVCGGAKDSGARCTPGGIEITTGILCSDGPDLSNKTKADAKANAAVLYGQSKYLGEMWSSITVSCPHMQSQAAWKLTPGDIKGNTTHPMLIISTSLDPVTPLVNAHYMSTKFPGSVVLEQNSLGHCSLSTPSLCTAKHVRAFFQTGVVPEPGTLCEVEELPLLGKTETGLRILSAEDETLLAAMKGLSESMENSGPLSLF